MSQFGCAIVFTKPHRSQTIVGVPCCRQLSLARFFGDLHSSRRSHKQERLRLIYLPLKASSENNYTGSHALISGSALKSMRWRVAACVTLFLHASPLVGASVADKAIHLFHASRRRRKSPSFSPFSLQPLLLRFFCHRNLHFFLCFLELYDIFRTLGVVSIDSY